MLALVRHLCPCGTSYVVSLAEASDLQQHPDWPTGMGSLAESLGHAYVDGREPGFFCPGCSRLHVRLSAPVASATHAGGYDAVEFLLPLSLN